MVYLGKVMGSFSRIRGVRFREEVLTRRISHIKSSFRNGSFVLRRTPSELLSRDFLKGGKNDPKNHCQLSNLTGLVKQVLGHDGSLNASLFVLGTLVGSDLNLGSKR